MNIFAGNLSFDTTETELRELFEEFGTVDSVKLISDRETGRSRGFAFVEMENSGGEAAIKALNGKDVQGRTIRVDQAEERKPRSNNRYR